MSAVMFARYCYVHGIIFDAKSKLALLSDVQKRHTA